MYVCQGATNRKVCMYVGTCMYVCQGATNRKVCVYVCLYVCSKETVAKIVVPVSDDNVHPLRETLRQIKYYLDRISSQQPEAAATQEPITINLLIEEEALRIKSRMSNMWDNNLKARRLAYLQSYRNKNIANKYAEWQELDQVIVPQWLQMKYIPNEPENLTKRREKQVLDNFKTEVEILNLRQQN